MGFVDLCEKSIWDSRPKQVCVILCPNSYTSLLPMSVFIFLEFSHRAGICVSVEKVTSRHTPERSGVLVVQNHSDQQLSPPFLLSS